MQSPDFWSPSYVLDDGGDLSQVGNVSNENVRLDAFVIKLFEKFSADSTKPLSNRAKLWES